ncbi:MAG: cadherin-like domain-containing protein [Planctomycetia bacterium]|nr:cadherin-like domain-containing protein [Planctomycetia bacterium]
MTHDIRRKKQNRARQFPKKPFSIMLFVMVLLILAGSGLAHDGTGMNDVIINIPPVANNNTAVTSKEISVDINIIANDADSDGTIDPTTVVITSNPANGSAVSNGDGTVTYTPDAGFAGTDSFTYTVQDNEGLLSNEATVTITIVSGTHVFTAYNDFLWIAGQVNTRITLYTTGQNGPLKDYFTGMDIPVILTIAGGEINFCNAQVQGSNAINGTDAYTVFSDIVNSEGLISYSGQNLTFAIAGLDPNLDYEFVLFGNRNNTSYDSRMTINTIADVVSFTNTSTPGADFQGQRSHGNDSEWP